MATSRPNAVVTRASEIPPATGPMPEDFWVAICWKAFRMPTTVPNRPTNGAVAPMVASTESPLFSLAWTMASALSSARPELAMVSSVAVPPEARNSCKASRNNFGQVRLLVAVGDLDRLFQLAVLQGAGNLRRELARLLAGSREVQVPIDH